MDVVGAAPCRTYKSASPAPPLISILRLRAPVGTENKNVWAELLVPPILVMRSGLTVLPPEVALKMAVTVLFAFRLNAHVPAPSQVPPLQPTKLLPADGVAVSVAVEPMASDSEQVLPQLMLPPDRMTIPEPEPTLATERVACGV